MQRPRPSSASCRPPGVLGGSHVNRYTMVATFATCSGPRPNRATRGWVVEQTDEQVHRRLLLLGEQRRVRCCSLATHGRVPAAAAAFVAWSSTPSITPAAESAALCVHAYPPLERVHQPTAPFVEEDEHSVRPSTEQR